jgi:aryl-alcohol dehydrogenase-like predicted oxidoreductase
LLSGKLILKNITMRNRKLTRRQFMTTMTAGAGTLMLGSMLDVEASGSMTASVDPFQQIILGKTGIKTTLLGMGTGFNGFNRTSAIVRAGTAESVIRLAFDKGIRFFDCADSYGTNPYTANALKGIPRESYTLGTKMWVLPGGVPDNEKGNAAVLVDRFRKELKTDYIDLVQLHCMTSGKWTTEQKQFMDDLENLKAKKIIRGHGVSVHSFEALEAAAESNWVDVIHVRINPFGEAMDKKDPALIAPVIEKLHKAGKGVIGMKLVGGGKFNSDSEKIDASLKYVLNLGTVDLLIIGFEQPEQIDNYVERIRKVRIG